jgi:hypothetical protein
MSLIPKGGNDVIQTPIEFCKLIIDDIKPIGKILEPCKGEGNFLKVLPDDTEWCEITEGKDFMNYKGKVDWIITNPPFSKFRAFLNKSMEVSNNVVFFCTINHIWLKARIRDINEKGFEIIKIVPTDTPKTFPQSGFQVGYIHLRKKFINAQKLEEEK